MVGDVYLFVLYNTVEAFALLYLGEWGEVREIVASALAIAERNVNPQASALCRLTIGWLHAEAKDFESAASLRRKRSIRLLKRIRSVSLSAELCWREAYIGLAQSALGPQAPRRDRAADRNRRRRDGVADQSRNIS